MAKEDIVGQILEKYIPQKQARGVFTESVFNKYVPQPVATEGPVIINGVSAAVPLGSTELAQPSSIEKIAKPVLTSWLKGKGGLADVTRRNAWDTDTVGGVTANEYWRRAQKFDNPSLPMDERLTQMIYGVETSGNPGAWNDPPNKFGYMGRAQMGRAIMSDYGIDPVMYMKDPEYQHRETVKTVRKRISELKGRYFRNGGKTVADVKNHHGNSKKEDLLIVNPVDGSVYGAMRYNETVFSQKDSDMIDRLITKGNPQKLGEFVAKARAKHEDVTMFKKGGKVADPTTKAAIDNRIQQLDSLKGKMPDSLYQKYRNRINSAGSYEQVVNEYKNALEEWNGLQNEPQSSQLPSATDIQRVKDGYVRQLQALDAPASVVNNFKSKLSKELTLENVLKYYDEATNEWTQAVGDDPVAKPKIEQAVAVTPDTIMRSLAGGNTAQKIQADIDRLKTKKQGMPAQESKLVDTLISGLESLKSVKPGEAALAPLKAIGDAYKALNNGGDAVAQRVRDAIGEEILGPIKAVGDAYTQLNKKGDDTATNVRSGIKEGLITPLDAIGKAYGTIGQVDELAKKYISGPLKRVAGAKGTLAYPNTPAPDITDFFSNTDLGAAASEFGKNAAEAVKNAASEFYNWAENRGNQLLGRGKNAKKIGMSDIMNSMSGIISGNANAQAAPATTPAASKPLTTEERRKMRRGTAPVNSGGGGGGGSASSGVGTLPEQTAVKVTQEYLNNFFAANAARQKGYTVGKDGAIFDTEGKRVPVDSIKSEAKNEQIGVDGSFGPETEAAIKIYNTANPDRQIKYRALSDGKLMLENTGFSKDAPDYLKKYYENGKVPHYDTIGEVKALTPKTTLGEIGIKEATPTIAPATPATATTAPAVAGNSAWNSDNLRRIGGNLADTFKIAALARQAGRPLPEYEQTEDWKKYSAMVENQATQGLNAAVQSQFNRNLNRNRAVGYGQVVAAAGGGGSSGAVLGALGNINQNSADAIGNFAVADQAQRDQNLSRFGNVAQTNENINLSMFSNELQNAQNSNLQAASMIPAISSQIEGRNDFYNAYGPDSSYQKLLDVQLQKQQSEVDLRKRLAENPSLLFPTGMNDTLAVSDADKALIAANKKRLGIR